MHAKASYEKQIEVARCEAIFRLLLFAVFFISEEEKRRENKGSCAVCVSI
jgi:hypothetical protein